MLLDGYYYYMWQCTSIRMSGGLQFKGAHPPSLVFFGGFCGVNLRSASTQRFLLVRRPLRLLSAAARRRGLVGALRLELCCRIACYPSTCADSWANEKKAPLMSCSCTFSTCIVVHDALVHVYVCSPKHSHS